MNKYLVVFFICITVTCTFCNRNRDEDTSSENRYFKELGYILNRDLKKEERKLVLDSIYNSISNIRKDSIRNKVLLEISYEYLKLNDSILFLETNRKAQSLSTELNDTIGLAASYWDLGNYYYRKNIADSAYYYYNDAQELYDGVGNKYYSARMLLNMAIIQKGIKDYTGSEITTVKSLALLKPLKKYNQLYSGYNNLGIIFDELENYDQSLFYYGQALNYLKKTSNDEKIPSIYNNIGVVYDNKGDHFKAINYFQKAINFRDSLAEYDPELYAMLLDNRAYAKFHVSDTLGIYQEFSNALKIRKDLNITKGMTINQLHLAEYMLAQGDTSKAIDYALSSKDLSFKSNNSRDLLSSLDLLSNIVNDSALTYSKQFIKINDSLQKQERAVRNKFARIRFETDEYKSEANKLSERIVRIILVSVILIIMFVLIYIINNQRARNRLINQKQIANQEIFKLVLEQQKKFEEGREKERLHISRELHDGILGKLFGIRLNLDSLNEEDDNESKSVRFKYIQEIKSIADQVRLLSHKLNKSAPTRYIDYQTVLSKLVEDQNAGNIQFELHMEATLDWQLIGSEIKLNIYRVLQEALSNIHKHSLATQVKIFIKEYNNNLYVEVVDDGVGFEAIEPSKGIGLKNIQERVKKIKGRMSIKSIGKRSKGTAIEITVPLN